MKKIVMLTAAALMIALPGTALAHNTSGAPIEHRHHMGNHQDWMKQQQKHQEMLLALVKQYSPDTLSNWQKVIADRNDLMKQFHDPALREKFKEAHKKQWDKLSEAEKQKLFQQKKAEWTAKKEAHKKFAEDLKAAMDAKDQAKIKQLLDQKYTEMAQKNKMLSDKIAELKSSN
ncbi:hypothetical protein [Falsibacillus pallidus]|uniref:hypothetical protein n=1 Tax=Falsibacillus pallidus TaxID=493781 RepID=UPI003D95247E